MNPNNYALPPGVHAIPSALLDLRPDANIDHTLLHPGPVTSEKNIWFFWHSGYANMHPYAQRNIRAWHRRFAPCGWTVRVVDRQPSSPLNIANFVDASNPGTFPRAFIDGTLGGTYAAQHTSDLVRWPLLLAHGGVYADVGMMQIGDLDRLWQATVGDPASGYEVLSYDGDDARCRTIMNYFMASRKENPLFRRCHRLLLKLWEGKTSTEGMHASPLLKGVPLMGGENSIDGEEKKSAEEVSQMLTDYIIQGQVMTMVLGLVDEEDEWDGPRYAKEHIYVIEFMVGAQLINEMTAWDGRKAFELMSLKLPIEGEVESEEQRKAREIVETCLRKSFGFKLAHGLILRVLGETLGSLWRKHEGSDDVPGTYAHCLRFGIAYWCQDEIPPPVRFDKVFEPFKRGALLDE